MAISDITKPMALDETLQGTNTKMDAVILKLQGIIDALGLDTSVYKPKGNITCAALIPALLIDDNLGNVYNVTDNGTTTSDFVEGAGKPIHVGDNVAIVDVGTGGQSEYKFDLLAGMVDLTNYIQKSNTSGLVKNDGTIDTKDYAEKVAGATSGNLAGLNGSGNLTDSGWNGAKDTTSISGNPISISGLKSNQLAKDPIITLEPIQAGSGTPSPVNQRPISGYDKIEVSSCGKNILPLTLSDIKKASANSSPTGSWSGNIWSGGGITIEVQYDNYGNVSGLKANGTANQNVLFFFADGINLKYTQYTFSGCPSGGTAETYRMDARSMATNIMVDTGEGVTFQASAGNNGYALIRVQQGTSVSNLIFKPQLEESETKTTFEPYDKTTDLSESLGQTVYGLTHEVRTGKAKVTQKRVKISDLTWQYWSSGGYFYTTQATDKAFGTSNVICSAYKTASNTENLTVYGHASAVNIHIRDDSYSGNVSNFVSAMGDQTICYELATPFTIQLTPHEISLLKDYAYVSTNGTNISLDYHNGELASLSDVSQLGETVNELGDKVSVKFKIVTDTASSVGNFDPSISNDNVIVGVESLSAQYIGLPFKNDGGNWRCRFLDTTNIAYIKNTSITAKIYYI